jgi:hypothetical protein
MLDYAGYGRGKPAGEVSEGTSATDSTPPSSLGRKVAVPDEIERIVQAARAVAQSDVASTAGVARLVDSAATLGAVVARMKLGEQPRLLTVNVTALADLHREDDSLTASLTGEPQRSDSDGRRELHTAVEVRSGEGVWLGDVTLVWA